jgi:hypothetical protein
MQSMQMQYQEMAAQQMRQPIFQKKERKQSNWQGLTSKNVEMHSHLG